MKNKYSRSLLLCPARYSLFNVFSDILKELSNEVSRLDIVSRLSSSDIFIHNQRLRFPCRIRTSWEKHFLNKANEIILKKINLFKPDLVLVYNHEFLLPETCVKIRKQARLVFFMGDSPFYTSYNDYYLSCLTYADLILSPDTFWMEQLKTMGLSKCLFFVPGVDQKSYHRLTEQEDQVGIRESSVLYAGRTYMGSWGYKKALLMSQFTEFEFLLYGNAAWRHWFNFFPDLKKCFHESKYVPTIKLNKLLNKTKLAPADGNPGILNGFHLRLFEVLSAGALPLVEYRKDVEEKLFSGCRNTIPMIRDYRRVRDTAAYFLKNEDERVELVKTLIQYISEQYNARNAAEYIVNELH